MVDIRDAVGRAHDLALERLGDKISGVAEDAHADLVGQVQPRAAALELVHHAQRLLIVAEWLFHHAGKRLFARVAERRVAQVVAVGRGLRQILIEPQPAADRPRDARDLQRVGHAGAVMVALRREEDLRLVHQPAERLAVQDAVGIALVAGAHVVVLLRRGAALRLGGLLGLRGENVIFLLLHPFAHGHIGPTLQCQNKRKF